MARLVAALVLVTATPLFILFCRLTGQKLDKKLLHADPEALMRARKQSKAKAAALQAAAAAEAGPDDAPGAAAAAAAAADLEGPEPQQQQEPERDAEQAAGDVEMLDAVDAAHHDAAAGQSAAAAGGNNSADARHSQQEQAAAVLEQEAPDALKPVTNGLSRKRHASPAEAAADDCGTSRPAKAARQLEHQPGVQQGQISAFAGASAFGAPADKQQQQQHRNPSGSQQQDGLQQQDQQQPAQQQPQGRFASDGVPVVAVQAVSAQAPAEADVRLAEQLLQRVVAAAAGMQLSELELLHARLSRVVAAHCQQQDRSAVLQQLGHILDGL
jgi:hypothetical protein